MTSLSRATRFVVLCLLAGCSSVPSATKDAGSTTDAGSTGASPVYVTFVSHNERNLARFDRFRQSLASYQSYRGNVLRIATLLAKYNARLSYQTDYVVLDGVEKYEATALAADSAATNGKPLFRYLSEDLGVSIEPHAHECIPNVGNPSHCSDKAYNYADVAARIRQVTGINPAAIVGGTTSAERTLDQWNACIRGNVFAETWCPEIITVFAGETGGHTGGDDFHAGVWRPSSLTTGFLTDNPNGKIAYIGSGYLFSTVFGARNVVMEPVDGVRKLNSLVDAGTLPRGKILTTSLMLVEDEFLDQGFYDELETILVDLKSLADSGRVVYATYPEVAAAWRASYGSSANVVEF